MAVGSVGKFQSAVKQGMKADSASGKKLTKAEAEKALTHLNADGKVSKAETKAVKDLLAKGALTAGAKDVLSAFVEKNDGGSSGSKKLNAATSQAILAQWNDLSRRGTVQFNAGIRALHPLYTQPLSRQNHPDGYAYSALLVLDGKTKGDPNKATSYYIKQEGGIAGWTRYAGPFQVPQQSRGGVGALVDNRTGGAGSDSSGVSRRRGGGGVGSDSSGVSRRGGGGAGSASSGASVTVRGGGGRGRWSTGGGDSGARPWNRGGGGGGSYGGGGGGWGGGGGGGS